MTFNVAGSKFTDYLYTLLFHLIPALFVDFLAICTGNKPRLYKMLTKIYKYLNVVRIFTTKNWTYETNNVKQMWRRLDSKDKKSFKFSLEKFDWSTYFRNYMMGVKLYLFKEDLNTLEASQERLQK